MVLFFSPLARKAHLLLVNKETGVALWKILNLYEMLEIHRGDALKG